MTHRRELGRQYHLITRDDRLETVAKDIVRHFLSRGFQGKAMVVSIDKATALRMHDKVRTHWQAEREGVERKLATAFKVTERTPELLDGVSRQADAESHADADHRTGQPRLPRQAQRLDRGLRERLRVAG